MILESEHIINKVFVEVYTNSSKEAFNVKDNLVVFLQNQVFAEMERYFDGQSIAFHKIDIRFEKIELDVNIKDFKKLDDLKSQILHQLRIKMDAVLQQKSIHTDEKGLVVESYLESNANAFLYFIKTGLKPWWKPDLSEVLIEKTIREVILQRGFYLEFVKALNYKNVQERLINQFDDSVLSLLLAIPDLKINFDKHKAFSILDMNVLLRHKFWTAIIEFHKFKHENNVKTALSEIADLEKKISSKDYRVLETYASLLIGKSLKEVSKLQKMAKKEEPIQSFSDKMVLEEEGLFIQHAGLVLMHPFFKQFFLNAKLLDFNGKLIQAKVETAIHLLHYLATKKTQPFESELVLEKFLCGFPIEQPMSRFIALSDELKQMAEEVLQAAITHWAALKNTSPDGLRTGFLQREGKLITENENTRIVVERKAQDILLDKLPWNLHLIKLLWRDKIIFVEW